LIAVSAPTAHAVDMAEAAGLTLQDPAAGPLRAALAALEGAKL
jgi:hypothetical protein